MLLSGRSKGVIEGNRDKNKYRLINYMHVGRVQYHSGLLIICLEHTFEYIKKNCASTNS